MKFAVCLLLIFQFSLTAFSQSDGVHPLIRLRNATTDSEKIEAYRAIYKIYSFSDPDSARLLVDEGIREFTAAGNKDGRARLLSISAYLAADRGELALAREKHKESLAISEKTGNKKGIASANNGIGILDAKAGNFSEATRHFLKALSIFESINDIDGVVNTYQKLGSVNDQANDYDKALEYYFDAIRRMETHPVKGTHYSWVYNNIGIVYGKKGELDKALSYFLQALERSDKQELIDIRILTLNNIGIVYDKKGEDKKALAYFDEAIELTKDKNLPENYARLCVSRASVISKTNPAAALEVLKDALITVQKLGLKSLEADIYDSMVETYDRLGKYKDALETLGLLRVLEDSLTNLEKSKALMNMQAVFELEQSKTQLTRAEEQNAAKDLVRNIVVGVAVALAVMLIVVIVLYRKSFMLNAKLVKREAELSRSNDIKDRLFSIIGHDLRGPVGNIPVMVQLLEAPSTTPNERKFIMDSLVVHSKASMDTLDKLLFWGQSQIKGIGMRQQEFKVGEHVRNNTELVKTSAEHKEISVINKIPDDLTVFADPSQFDFIVRNLLSNAIKFTHTKGTVTLAADPKSKPGLVVFSVSDTGVGINAEKLPDIFMPFSSSTRGTADEKGTSIGLMLCKEFINENGGDIWIDTAEGKGSTFYFSLKAANA